MSYGFVKLVTDLVLQNVIRIVLKRKKNWCKFGGLHHVKHFNVNYHVTKRTYQPVSPRDKCVKDFLVSLVVVLA